MFNSLCGAINRLTKTKICIVNYSSLETDAIEKVRSALQRQVNEHFAPVWGKTADLEIWSEGKQLESGTWWLTISADKSDTDYHAYHIINRDSVPEGRLFLESIASDGLDWSVVASQEVLEMLANPGGNLYAMIPSRTGYDLYQKEVCEPCLRDSKYVYEIDGVTVSDFVYPAWFEKYSQPEKTKFDHLGKVSLPLYLWLQGQRARVPNV